MLQAILNRAGENMAGAAHRASRASFAIGEAIEDGAETVKRVVHQGSHIAEDLLDNATRKLRKKPIEAVLASLTLGVAVGFAMGWLMRRPSA